VRNVERVHRAYEAWNRDHFEAVRELLHPEVEWHSSGLFAGLEPVNHGHEGVRRWWRQLKEPWESFTIEVRRELERGGTVITDVRFRAVGRESGVEVDLPFAHVFEFEDGLVVRYRSFGSLEEALAAAGG
jgi:ketosteroid isomerase-like protein